jgi:small subunit ribosomal protein S6
MPIYETIVILDSLLSIEDIDRIVNRIKDIIEGEKCKIIQVDKWGKRRLAYDIKKKQYGFYVSVILEGHGKISAMLEREYNFNDNILRYLTYCFDKNKVKIWQKEKEKEKEVKGNKDKIDHKTKKINMDTQDAGEVADE